MKQYLQVSCHALIGSSFLALALTDRLDPMSIAIYLGAFSLSFYRTVTRKPALLTERSAFYLSCFYVFFFIFDAGTLSRSLIASTVHMVLFLEAVKLFQEKTDKDYFYLIILAFLKILAAASLTIDISFAGTLLLFLVALVSTLMTFDMYRAQRQAHTTARITSFSLGGMSVWATGWIVIVAAAFFFVIPRVGTGYFTQASISPLLLSGFSEDVRLGQVGEVKLGTAIVMHATRRAGTPFAVLKWRGVALDNFDGTRWSKSNRSRKLIRGSGGAYPIVQTPVSGEIVRYEILLEPIEPPALLGPHQVRGVSGQLSPSVEVDDDDSIYTRFPQSRRIQYEVSSEIAKRNTSNGAAGNVATLPAEKKSTYLQLPEDLDRRVIDLALSITKDASTPQEKAARIETYLKQNYQYTLMLTWNPGNQPLTTFLLDTKSGHCEYFASSMAILLRAAGVPTRLVNGFLMGEYNPVSNAYVVRQSDAHSWVEVHLPDNGWTEFDPTPPDSDSPRGLTAQLGNYLDAARLFWNSYLLTYDTDNQIRLFYSAQEMVQQLQSYVQDGTERASSWTKFGARGLSSTLLDLARTGWIWVFAPFVALGAAYPYRRQLQEQWWLWNIRRRRSGTDAQMDAVVALLFRKAVRLAQRGSSHRKPAQTWREWLAEMPQPERRSILAGALDIFEKSTYGRRGASLSDFEVMERAVNDLRSLLQ